MHLRYSGCDTGSKDIKGRFNCDLAGLSKCVAASRVERTEQKCRVYIRKWLGLPRQLNNTALYGKGCQLELPLASTLEDYRAGKVRTVMKLRYSKDKAIREDPPEVHTGKKWTAEEELRQSNEQLEAQRH
ncbi:hypothetical protein ACROYT_G030544 [Oculina patagonica]